MNDDERAEGVGRHMEAFYIQALVFATEILKR
jgi:hypothetical protein